MIPESSKADRFLAHLQPLQGALEAYCRHQVNDVSAVEDVLQSCLAEAFADFHRYHEGTNFRAWIFRYLNLTILNWNRRYERCRAAAVDPSDPNDPVAVAAGALPQQFAADELTDQPDQVLEHCDAPLAAAIGRLSSDQRAVLLLRAVGEFKYREIATILEVPVGTVMSHLSRARAKLRRELTGEPTTAETPVCDDDR